MSQGIGRPLIGLVSDKFGRLNVAGLGTLVAGLTAFFLWTFAGKVYSGLIVYSVFGMFSGIVWPCVAPVGAEVVGLQLLPAGKADYPLFTLRNPIWGLTLFSSTIHLLARVSFTGYLVRGPQLFLAALDPRHERGASMPRSPTYVSPIWRTAHGSGFNFANYTILLTTAPR